MLYLQLADAQTIIIWRHFNNVPIFFNDVGCRGDEAKLVDCSRSRVTLCFQNEIAGVVCPEGVVDTSMQL